MSATASDLLRFIEFRAGRMPVSAEQANAVAETPEYADAIRALTYFVVKGVEFSEKHPSNAWSEHFWMNVENNLDALKPSCVLMGMRKTRAGELVRVHRGEGLILGRLVSTLKPLWDARPDLSLEIDADGFSILERAVASE